MESRAQRVRPGSLVGAHDDAHPPASSTRASVPPRPSSISGAIPVAKPPVLASECLKDDVAPLEPHARALRVAYGAIAAGLAGIAALSGLAARSIAAPAAFGAAALAAILAAASPAYVLRARLALAASVLSATGGLAAVAAGVGSMPIIVARVVTGVALASVLFVRGTYRAHRPTRVALAIAIPLFAATALAPSAAPVAELVVRAAIVVTALLACLGFMGIETTAGCLAWAVLTIGTATGALVVDAAPSGAELASVGAGLGPSVGAGLAIALGALGVFQLVALRVAPRERARDDRTPAPPKVA